MKKYVLFIFALFLIPSFTHAAVSITEVAWMGIEGTNGQYGEWLELYNDGDQPVNLSGWKINKTDNKLLISLTKTIPANSYFLVERVTGSVHDPIPGVEDISSPFGNSGLSNTGEDLVLIDDNGNEIQRLPFAAKWPAGSAETKQTMQWDGSAWVTAPATPRAVTTLIATETEENTDVETKGDTQDIVTEKERPSSGNADTKQKESIAPSPNKPYILFDFPKAVYSGIEYTYTIQPILEYNYQIRHGIFTFNFGDGTVVQQRELEPVMHTYQYPGTYTVSFSYKEDKDAYGVYLVDSQKVEVAGIALAISSVDNAAIQITNKYNTPIDLSNFKIATYGVSSTFPALTILASKSSIVVPRNSLGLPLGADTVQMFDPSGKLIAKTD